MKSILLVEDDKVLGKALSQSLQQKGYKLELAEDAEQARQKLKNSKFDLIVLDLLLPGESGIEFLRKLRKQERFKKIKVLVASNYPEKFGEDLKKLSVQGFLVKSDSSLKEVVEAIESL